MTAWQECLFEAIERAEAIGLDKNKHNPVVLVLVAEGTGRRISYTLNECQEELAKLLDSDCKL